MLHVATLKVGDQCVSNGPVTAKCAGLNTYCTSINNTCVCDPGYVANSDGMDCSSSAPVQAPTPIGGNCTGNFCGCKCALRCQIIIKYLHNDIISFLLHFPTIISWSQQLYYYIHLNEIQMSVDFGHSLDKPQLVIYIDG